jgi:hypothetical protein
MLLRAGRVGIGVEEYRRNVWCCGAEQHSGTRWISFLVSRDHLTVDQWVFTWH